MSHLRKLKRSAHRAQNPRNILDIYLYLRRENRREAMERAKKERQDAP